MNRLISIFIIFIFFSCKASYQSEQDAVTEINIYPDYSNVTIPRNIAPLNFIVKDSAESYIFEFMNSTGELLFSTNSNDANSNIPIKKWKKALNNSSLKEISICVGIIKNNIKYNYKPIKINISDDNIDNYIAYRKIEPGYVNWRKMGIYERDITSWDEQAIFENTSSDQGCVNCHSFCQNSPDRYMLHFRQNHAGTVIYIDGKAERFDTKVGSMMNPAAYPAWHPSGRYIAFSTNITQQSFFHSTQEPVEVFDLNSNLVIYDTKENKMFSHKYLYDENMAESFPSWSSDGKHLYFVSAKRATKEEFEPTKLKYNLYRVEFDPSTQEFSNYELLFDAEAIEKSVAVPRVYHDDTKVSLSMSDYGTFSIWHDESDLVSYDLNNKTIENLEILNSDLSESYRSFSSNGNWLVFTSRRDDGLYTRLYIAHYDKQSGEFSKPFMLPQKYALSNYTNEKSYNIPEFITSQVPSNDLFKAIRQEPKKINKGANL